MDVMLHSDVLSISVGESWRYSITAESPVRVLNPHQLTHSFMDINSGPKVELLEPLCSNSVAYVTSSWDHHRHEWGVFPGFPSRVRAMVPSDDMPSSAYYRAEILFCGVCLELLGCTVFG